MKYNKFSSYIYIKQDQTIINSVDWWKGSQSIYSKLSKMTQHVSTVSVTSSDIEWEYSISERVIT